MATYVELLRDPRWQKRRLEILDRADFRCESCFDDKNTLHVHHRIYRKGALPWEYEDRELVALCEDCHTAEHERRQLLNEALALLSIDQLERVLGYAQGLVVLDDKVQPLHVTGFEQAKGVLDAARIPQTELIPVVINQLVSRDDLRKVFK